MNKANPKSKITVDAKLYKLFKSFFSIILILVMVFIGGATITSHADSKKDSYNLQSVGNALSNVFSLSLTPSGISIDDGSMVGEVVAENNVVLPWLGSGIANVYMLADSGEENTGDAGLVVGITGETTSVGQWIASMISGSSASYDYISLQDIKLDNAGTAASTTDAAYYYAVYGHLLKDAGFDKTTTNTTGNVHPIRMMAGSLISLAYWAATVVYKLFAVAIMLLQALNPFFWLSGIAADYSSGATTLWGTTAIYSLDEVGAASGSDSRNILVATVAGIYVTMANLSWGIIIPLIIAFYFFGVFALRKSSGTKRLLTRVIFLAIGIPVIGALYTGFLSDMENLFESQTTTCDEIILSTFVDFENWAKYSHLAIDSGMILSSNLDNRNGNTNSTAGTATSGTIAKLRTTCLLINKKAGSSALDVTFETSAESSDSNNVANSVSFRSTGVSNSSTYVSNVLSRYMSGDIYTPNAFASYVQTSISKGTGVAKGISPSVYAQFLKSVVNLQNYKVINDNEEWWKNSWDTISKIFASEEKFSSDSNAFASDDNASASYRERLSDDGNKIYDVNGALQPTIFNNGNIETVFTTIQNNTLDDEDDAVYASSMNGIAKFKQDVGTYGLSTMSMYNYLSTDFTNDSVVVYGGGDAPASGLTQKKHYSINIIGTGITTLIYWADCFTLLTCLAFIGLFYSVGMISHAIKNSLSVITSMPMAMLGSMRYMAKLIGIVITMVANVLVTAILYGLAGNFLLGVSQFIESIISTVIRQNPNSSAGKLVGYVIISRILVNVFCIIITINLIKIRKQTINQISELVQQVVTKFMDADSHGNPDKPKAGIGQKLMAGVGQGAGMAIGNKMAKGAQSQIEKALGKGKSDGDDETSGKGPNGGGSKIENEGDAPSNVKPTASQGSSGSGSESSGNKGIETSKKPNESQDGKSESNSGAPSKTTDAMKNIEDKAEKAESVDKTGTSTVAKETAKDLGTLSDSNATKGEKAKAAIKGGATIAATAAGGTKAGEATSKTAGAIDSASSKHSSSERGGGSMGDENSSPIRSLNNQSNTVVNQKPGQTSTPSSNNGTGNKALTNTANNDAQNQTRDIKPL